MQLKEILCLVATVMMLAVWRLWGDEEDHGQGYQSLENVSSCIDLSRTPVHSSLFAINVLSSAILLGTFGPQQSYFLKITTEKKSVTWVFAPGYSVGEPE